MKIKNPKLSVTIGENAYVENCYYLDSSNNIHFSTEVYESKECIAVKSNSMFVGAFFDSDYTTVGDMVNCTADAESGMIIITDPTKDASCTVNP